MLAVTGVLPGGNLVRRALAAPAGARNRFASVAFAIGLALTACGDDGDACPRMRACAITERTCQEQVMKAVACMRHSEKTALPKVSVVDREAYRARLLADARVDEDAEQDAADYAVWNRGLALLELAPADYDQEQSVDDQVAQIAAAYLPRTKEIVVIDGVASSVEDETATFAHEVVHALQDADLDLAKYQAEWANDYDASLAVHALIEGEATHYELLTMAQLVGRDPHDIDWQQLYTAFRAEVLQDADTDEAPVALASLRFSYAFGGGFVSQHWIARGRAGVDALFDAPPRTTSEIMFGSREGAGAARKALDAHAVPEPADGFEPAFSTSLGAWIARMFAARMGVESGRRNAVAFGLAADRFSIQLDAAHDVVASAWRARFFDGVQATAWPALEMPELPGQSTSTEDGREAFTLVAEGGEQRDLDAVAWQSPDDDATADDEEGTAALRPPPFVPNPARAFSCAARRPRL
jgi:hypothetical protein